MSLENSHLNVDYPKRALVCGAAGLIGSHLVKHLVSIGYWVRGVDIVDPEFSPSAAHEFLKLDLRVKENCERAVFIEDSNSPKFDEVYQLAADMGGMGFIHSAETEILHNNALINIHMIDSAARKGISRFLFSSSVCVYRNMLPGEPEMKEEDAIPANPDNEYGWEKLFSERVVAAYGRKFPITVHIARFQNCYGPDGKWQGGREKAPAAICRKIAEVEDGGEIEIWGDGAAVRSYIHVTDLTSALVQLMHSDLSGPVNIGSSEYLTVNELVGLVAEIAGKTVSIKYVDGPVGVQSRNFSHDRICSTGWKPTLSLKDGLKETYSWIKQQVQNGSHTIKY